MNKVIDFIALRLTAFILLFIWILYISDFLTALIISGILVVIFSYILTKTSTDKKSKYKESDLAAHLQLMGNEYSLALYLGQTVDNRYVIDNGALTYANFKFGKTSCDDVAAAYRLAVKNNINNIILLTNEIDRNALLLAEGLKIDFKYVKTKEIFKKLKALNRLPEIEPLKTPGIKIKAEAISKVAFSKTAMIYYLFSGVMLALMSFITPLKVYYLIMSSVMLIMSIISAFIKK